MFLGGQVGATVWMWYNQDVFCIIRVLDLQFIPVHPAASCGTVNGDLSLVYTYFLLIIADRKQVFRDIHSDVGVFIGVYTVFIMALCVMRTGGDFIKVDML